jgi:hypothetical protein
MYNALIARGYLFLGDQERCREHLFKFRQSGAPDRILLVTDPDLAKPLSELPPSANPLGIPS